MSSGIRSENNILLLQKSFDNEVSTNDLHMKPFLDDDDDDDDDEMVKHVLMWKQNVVMDSGTASIRIWVGMNRNGNCDTIAR